MSKEVVSLSLRNSAIAKRLQLSATGANSNCREKEASPRRARPTTAGLRSRDQHLRDMHHYSLHCHHDRICLPPFTRPLFHLTTWLGGGGRTGLPITTANLVWPPERGT